MSKIQTLRLKWKEAGKAEEFDRRLGLMADVVIRHSTLNKAEAIRALEDNELSIERAILSVNQPPQQVKSKPKSLNQQLFTEFRSFLDDAAHKHAARTSKRHNNVDGTKDQMPDSSSAS